MSSRRLQSTVMNNTFSGAISKFESQNRLIVNLTKESVTDSPNPKRPPLDGHSLGGAPFELLTFGINFQSPPVAI